MRGSTYQGAGIVDASDNGARSLYRARISETDLSVISVLTNNYHTFCMMGTRRCYKAFTSDSQLLSDRPAKDIQQLIDTRILLLCDLTWAAEKAGVELFGEQRILEALDHPVDNR